MTEELSEAIVLQDGEGRYYVIPTEALEDALVPDEAKGAIDADLAEVSGFSPSFSYVGNLSLSSMRVRSTYGFRANAWPCDTPVVGPGGMQQPG